MIMTLGNLNPEFILRCSTLTYYREERMYWSDVGHRAIAAAGINDGTGLTVLVNQLQNITIPGTDIK